MVRLFLTNLIVVLLHTAVWAQSKVSVTITNPNAFDLCVTSDDIAIEVRNITASTVTGLETTVDLPVGVRYVLGSLSGAGVSELNTTDLNKPIFSLQDLSLAQARTLKIKVEISCSMSAFLNGGGLAVIKTDTRYTGGNVAKNSAPMNIKQPALQLVSVSNQLYTADLGEVFVREMVFKNSGTGKLRNFTFMRRFQSGLEFIRSSASNSVQTTDSFTSTLDSADIIAVGDGDQYFELNETFTIRDTIKVVACTDLKELMSIGWGCSGEVCKSINSSANVTLSNKKANLLFTPTSEYTNCMSSSDGHDQQLVIYNAGNDTARGLDLNIFQAINTGYYNRMLSRLDYSSFTYQFSLSDTGTSINPRGGTNTLSTGVFSCLGSNAIGEVFLALADLAPGDSVIVRWKSYSCCPPGCNVNGIYAQRWKYKSSFIDQCGDSLKTNEAWGSFGMYQRLTTNKFNPTDILDGQTKRLEYTVTSGALFRPLTSSQLKVELILPSGLSHSLSASDLGFIHPNGGSWLPSYFTQSGDTVRAVFNGRPSVALTRSELLINITGDCATSTSNKELTYKVNISYNPDTTCASNCEMYLLCDSDKIKLHCANSCNAGLHFNDFEARRINYGQPDANNDGLPDATGAIDLDKIKTNRVMYGDTVMTTFRAKVYNAGSTTNWYYGKAVSTLDWGRYLSVQDVRIKIYRQGNLLFNCNNINHTVTTAGNSKTFTFDISYNNLVNSGCVLYSTFAYLSVDSVELEVTYVVDENPGNAIRNLNFTNDFYLSTVANPTTSQKYQCDSFSARLSLIGSYFTNYGRNVWNTTGCNTMNAYQSYYLSIGQCCSNYGGGNIFPYEYRKWAKLREIIFSKPAGLDLLNGQFYQYRTAGTGNVVTERVDTILPYSTTPTQVKFRVDSLYSDAGGSVNISDDGFHGTFQATMVPNCKLQDGLSDLEYGFVFERVGSFGPGYDTVYTTTQNDEVNYLKPKFTVTPKSNDVYAQSDTAEWQVRVSNTTSAANASNVWLSGRSSGSVKIIEIIDLATNLAVPKQVDIFKLGDINGLGQKDYLIKALFTSCDRDSLDLLLGFDCTGYPDSLEAYPCDPLEIKLYYEPLNTRLEAVILDTTSVVDLCEERTYSIRIRNTGNPKVYDLVLDMLLRPGMVLNDSAYLFVDGRSDSVLITSPSSVGSNTYRWNIAAQDDLLDSLGLNGVGANAGYFATLKIKLKTDCDFTSSTFFLVKPGGYLKCGSPVDASFTVGDPINIKGVNKPYFSSMSLSIQHMDVCNYNDSTYISFINLGPDTTGLTDGIILSLPIGVEIDTTYIDAGHNAPISGASYELKNGENVYTYKIPSGIGAGDSMNFRLATYLNNNALSCGIKQIFAQAVIKQPVLCVEDSTYCEINVATSSILKTDSVEKSVLSLTYNGASSIPSQSNESVSMSYQIDNSGSNKTLGDLLLVDVIYDQNGNGLRDSGEQIIARDSVWAGIPSQSAINRSFAFDVPADWTCDLLLHVSDSNCVCGPTTIEIPSIQVLNAGPDTTACPLTPFTIGTEGNSSVTYRWNHQEFVGTPDSSYTLFSGTNFASTLDTVLMILTTDKGSCSSKDTVVISLHPQMVADLQDSAFFCRGGDVIIGEVISGGVSNFKDYQWTPTDSLSRPNGVKTRAYPDSSTMYRIVATDQAGCVFTDSTYVTVIEAPIADFSMKDSCAENNFAFADLSDYRGTVADSIHWQFGSLDASNFSTPQLYIDSSQFVDVALYVSNAKGCWDTVTKTLEVFPLPEVDLAYLPACEGDSITLIAQSRIDYSALQHVWTVADNEYNGDSLSLLLPYDNPLNVGLMVRSEYGCQDDTSLQITIYDRPSIGLNADSVCLGRSAALSVQELSGTVDTISSYLWDYGDGTSGNGTGSAAHLYSDTGIYQVQIIVSNAKGCQDSASATVKIHENPRASFTATDVCYEDTVVLTDGSSIQSSSIASHYWDLGAGFALGSAEKRTSAVTGTHTARLRVETEEGCSDTVSNTFDVFYKEVPQLVVNGNCENERISLQSSPQFLDSINAVRWVIGTDTFYGLNLQYDFPSDGIYEVEQQLLTTRGCLSDSVFSVQVDPAPEAEIKTDLLCSDNQVDFESSASLNAWDLGDGNSSSLSKFRHTYDVLGTYNVQLVVTNNFGCKDTTLKEVNIDFIVMPDFAVEDICAMDEQWVRNLTTGYGIPISRSTFDMGDGNKVQSSDSFLYAYSSEGTYDITLTVTTTAGCDYDTVKQVTIYPLPIADFDVAPPLTDIFNASVKITDFSSLADSLIYRITDGSEYINIEDLQHDFLDSGTYEVEQWVATRFGCMDSLTKSVIVEYAYKLFIPNAFSPHNKDGRNDVFQPIGFGLDSYEMVVYNRWGQEVFRSEQPNEPWTGKNAFMGYYVYKIKAIDFEGKVHHYSGGVYLME